MAERTGLVTLRGNPVTLVGNAVKVGDNAPDATLKGAGLKDVKLSEYKGKVVILSVVPSLDTPVCDLQSRRFNKEAGTLGDKAAVLTVSMDLPMAQARWCGAADAKNIVTLSDYKDRQFGQAWGLYMKENGLLARAVYVVDKAGIIRMKHIGPISPEVWKEKFEPKLKLPPHQQKCGVFSLISIGGKNGTQLSIRQVESLLLGLS